jgi:hypothetical protein
MSGIAWLPDQSGLVISGMPQDGQDSSLWILSYPDGALRRITSDIADYYGVSLDRSGDYLVTAKG